MYLSTAEAENFNDFGDLGKFDKFARWFVEWLAGQERFPLYHAGKTYLYDGTRYVPCDELPMLIRDFMKAKKIGQSNNVVGNVKEVVQSIAWRDATVYGPMPFWHGPGQPFQGARHVVTFRNGLLDLSGDAKLTPHSPHWCSSSCLPFDYDPAAACPRWVQFLKEVFEGDDERADLLGEFIGYCLVPDISHQKALLMLGESRSGKGTIAGVIAGLLGSGYTGFSLPLLITPHGPTQLRNKLVAVVGEVELANDPNRVKIVEGLKAVIGGDEIVMNEKHNPRITSERVLARFVIAANRKPSLFDASGALLNRMLLLPFDVSFAGREDTSLEAKLRAELPGIANWALAGLKRLRSNGRFTVGAASRAAAADFGARTAPVLSFVRERLLVHPSISPGHLPVECLAPEADWTSNEGVYDAYVDWCAEKGEIPDKREYFGKDFGEVLRKVKRRRRTVNNSRLWGYAGVGIRPAPAG
ncbi:hypothetical protein J0H58_16520 [bacterium]|nr:hypothetical protein [bacterium]